jgi:hypothetical protein
MRRRLLRERVLCRALCGFAQVPVTVPAGTLGATPAACPPERS